MDTENGVVTRNDVLLHLHPMEFKLLQFLMSHQNQVFNAHALFERLWQKNNESMEDTVRTHIRTLRRKLDPEGGPSIITTVRGFGYKVSDQPSSDGEQPDQSISKHERSGDDRKIHLICRKPVTSINSVGLREVSSTN